MVKYNKLFEDVLDGKNNQKEIRKMLSDNGGFLKRHPARGYNEYVYGPTEEHPDSCRVVLEAKPEGPEGEKYTAETYIYKKDVDLRDPEHNDESGEKMYDRLEEALADLTEDLKENGYEDFKKQLLDEFIDNQVNWEWIVRIAESVLYARDATFLTRVKNKAVPWLNW